MLMSKGDVGSPLTVETDTACTFILAESSNNYSDIHELQQNRLNLTLMYVMSQISMTCTEEIRFVQNYAPKNCT